MMDRRTVLTLCSGSLTAAFGGCLQLQNDPETSDDATQNREREPEPTPTPSAAEQTLDDEALEWISATEYDGITDRTGRETATVTVGNDDLSREFQPAILRVSTGTTVRWEWAGEGGGHSVVAEGGTFGTDRVLTDSSRSYGHGFAEPGTYRYYCEPHRDVGGRGLVIVTES
jgi:halocyanin-like protein